MASIEIRGLTKRYGDVTAVDGLSFDVRPGLVTGFLGPNGAGKSTTMRAVVGLERPDAGTVAIGGRRYQDLPRPLTHVGALLEAKATHPGRSARDHLLFLARSNGLPARRVDEVLELAGIASVARKRVGAYSLGMGQRLGIAAALLGDPPALLLDEPVNGLDPEGIRWMRGLLRSLAAEGRAVLVSSHLLSEMANTADHLVVIGQGRLLADLPFADFMAAAGGRDVLVRTPDPDRLTRVLVEARQGVSVVAQGDGAMAVCGLDAAEVGEAAAAAGVVLHELTPRTASLEDVFMNVTKDAVSFSASARSLAGAGTEV
jgi:ABC-2 type transport system ATP-binding protein